MCSYNFPSGAFSNILNLLLFIYLFILLFSIYYKWNFYEYVEIVTWNQLLAWKRETLISAREFVDSFLYLIAYQSVCRIQYQSHSFRKIVVSI